MLPAAAHGVALAGGPSSSSVSVCRAAAAAGVNLGKPGEHLLDGILDCIHEVTAALAASAGRMSDSAYRVETAPRLAQWRIDSLSSCAYRKSDPFRIGPWNWSAIHTYFSSSSPAPLYLSVERNKQVLIRLFPEASALTRERPPIASFVISVVSAAGNRRTIVHPGICDKQLKNNDDFVWAIDTLSTGKLIIDVEFLDLKTVPPSVNTSTLPASSLSNLISFCVCAPKQYSHITMFHDHPCNWGGEPSSIWTGNHLPEQAAAAAVSSLGRMLSEGILTDITINATDGSIGAHRAVLAARSPVFRSMFSHNLREKELSAVDIPDMSVEACQAFLNYVYGSVRPDEFLTHRLALLRAADKYGIDDLMEACHESLTEDIDTKNVLERLQTAYLYRLPKLKGSCMRYLVSFGKIYDIGDEFNAFLQCADRDLIVEVFHDILSTWKGF
ncbi:hypothetical protein Taro_048415 [Colocasia esculenta]|uniref:BTB domain-containing protein n=1 Tax=Colocasia esculenta TaxID=4460 RepID=A0A843X2P3_COLES|nr:hypothetical protein [Colocasia esculenta]